LVSGDFRIGSLTCAAEGPKTGTLENRKAAAHATHNRCAFPLADPNRLLNRIEPKD
jgi:hypothetical protein